MENLLGPRIKTSFVSVGETGQALAEIGFSYETASEPFSGLFTVRTENSHHVPDVSVGCVETNSHLSPHHENIKTTMNQT